MLAAPRHERTPERGRTGLGPSAMALAEHANGALVRWKVEVASRQAKRGATLPEDDSMSMHTDDTAARRLGRTRVP